MLDRALILLALASLAACETFPELDEAVSDEARNAPYPEIVSLATLPLGGSDARVGDEDIEDLQKRADALNDRADRIRAQSLSPEDRARLTRSSD